LYQYSLLTIGHLGYVRLGEEALLAKSSSQECSVHPISAHILSRVSKNKSILFEREVLVSLTCIRIQGPDAYRSTGVKVFKRVSCSVSIQSGLGIHARGAMRCGRVETRSCTPSKRVSIKALWPGLIVVTLLFFAQRWFIGNETGTSPSAIHLISGEAVCPVDALSVGVPRREAVVGSGWSVARWSRGWAWRRHVLLHGRSRVADDFAADRRPAGISRDGLLELQASSDLAKKRSAV
jgi:hypothetical protein